VEKNDVVLQFERRARLAGTIENAGIQTRKTMKKSYYRKKQ